MHISMSVRQRGTLPEAATTGCLVIGKEAPCLRQQPPAALSLVDTGSDLDNNARYLYHLQIYPCRSETSFAVLQAVHPCRQCILATMLYLCPYCTV